MRGSYRKILFLPIVLSPTICSWIWLASFHSLGNIFNSEIASLIVGSSVLCKIKWTIFCAVEINEAQKCRIYAQSLSKQTVEDKIKSLCHVFIKINIFSPLIIRTKFTIDKCCIIYITLLTKIF